jgi:hypothetical protein
LSEPSDRGRARPRPPAPRGLPPLALALAALVLLGLAPAVSAQAPGRAGDDRVVISGPVDVPAGESTGDVVVIDGPVSVEGTVRGDLIAISGTVTIAGRVDGDVVAVSERATLESGARIGGDLVWVSRRPAVAGDATVAGDIRRANVDALVGPFDFVGRLAVWLAVSVSTLALGLLLLWLAPRALEAAWRSAARAPGAAIGLGLALFIGLPILAVVALVTLLGIPFGIGLLLALLPLYATAYTVAAWLLGRRLAGSATPVLSFLAGLGILRVLALIPAVGGLVWLAASAFGLGALVLAIWRARAAGTPLREAAA